MINKTILTYFFYCLLLMVGLSILETIHLRFMFNKPLHIKYYLMPELLALFFGIIIGRIYLLKGKVSEVAYTDSLTGIPNRLWLHERMQKCLANSRRYETDFSVILLDIDNFKKINDTYGHLVGDEVLLEVAHVLEATCRESDYCARWGGEEFIVLLPNTDAEGAAFKAERLRKAIEEKSFKNVGRVTSSFGIAQYRTNAFSCSEVINHADKALYRAKKRGKNRVESFVLA